MSSKMYLVIKRLLDILISLIALPFVLLVVLIFAPIIYFTDRGPVFYNAPRLGRKGKVFKMYKLRSMKVNAPNIKNADGSTYNGENDPRVTPVGRFMRKTSIDELPQFLNVLKGDLSLIGPRAHTASATDDYDSFDENSKRRLDVRPGITGYSQAYFRNSITADKKIENDVYYVNNLSFGLDVKILVKTVVSVVKRENIYVTPNVTEEKKDAAEASDEATEGKETVEGK